MLAAAPGCGWVTLPTCPSLKEQCPLWWARLAKLGQGSKCDFPGPPLCPARTPQFHLRASDLSFCTQNFHSEHSY